MQEKKVLVFDDEKDILYMCRLILESKGFKVETRENCRNVVEDVATFKPDVVIMDNLIPDHGGVMATQDIKAAFAHIPVILFTASKNIDALAKEAGSDAFIAKPFDIHEMVDVINGFVKQ